MKNILILLHGVGSSGTGMQGVVQYLQQALPEVIIAAPDGTAPFDGGAGGYQWFSIAGVTEQNRAQRIAAARGAFDAKITALLQQQGITPQQDNIMLLGFSQGAIMALDVLATGRFPLAGVVSCSGRLASPAPFSILPDSAALFIHGKADTVIPWTESESAASRFSEHHVAVETFFEPGAPHTITPAGLDNAIRFLTARHRFSTQAKT